MRFLWWKKGSDMIAGPPKGVLERMQANIEKDIRDSESDKERLRIRQRELTRRLFEIEADIVAGRGT